MIEEKELNNIILNNIESLGKSNVDIFVKFYYEDKSIKQISKELNMTKANVKIKLYRTRKKIKKILEKGGIENV
jgi:RNA polymerase sigma-70 factor (ECF subfamily)